MVDGFYPGSIKGNMCDYNGYAIDNILLGMATISHYGLEKITKEVQTSLGEEINLEYAYTFILEKINIELGKPLFTKSDNVENVSFYTQDGAVSLVI